MNLELIRVENAGDLERERVVLQAASDTDVGRYAIFLGRLVGDNKRVASGAIASAYWFPDKAIKKNDFVVLYSKAGGISEKTGESGVTSYFYYWGKTAPCWIDTMTPILINTADWKFISKAKV